MTDPGSTGTVISTASDDSEVTISLDAKQRKMCEGRRRSAYKLGALTKRTLRCGRSAPGEPQTLARTFFWARGLGLLARLAGTLSSVASAPLHDPLRPQFAASVEIVTVHAGTGEVIPARVYLFKGGKPFRLSPVESLLPLRPDLFYRERLWRREDQPKTLEVTASDMSHLILLTGRGRFDLPRSRTDIGEPIDLKLIGECFLDRRLANLRSRRVKKSRSNSNSSRSLPDIRRSGYRDPREHSFEEKLESQLTMPGQKGFDAEQPS